MIQIMYDSRNSSSGDRYDSYSSSYIDYYSGSKSTGSNNGHHSRRKDDKWYGKQSSSGAKGFFFIHNFLYLFIDYRYTMKIFFLY